MPPSVVDPYMSLSPAGTTFVDQPPSVAPPGTGKDTVLQIYVPAEHTLIDYGAGQVPGIRMATDRHVHLTARTPLTTISLGNGAGQGVSGSPGLNIATDGDKHEHVKGQTQEEYIGPRVETSSNNKTENVFGVWTQLCHNAKNEVVAGTVTESFNSEHNMYVGKPSKYRYGESKDERVNGVYVLDIGGSTNRSYGGDVNETYCGQVSTTSLGTRQEFKTDNHVTTNKGMKIDVFAGLTVSTNATLSFSQNAIAKSFTGASISTTLFNCSGSVVNVEIPALKIIK